MIRATIQLVLDVDDEAEAADAVNEILRGQQRSFTEGSCLIDYAIFGFLGSGLEATSYNEGDAFQ